MNHLLADIALSCLIGLTIVAYFALVALIGFSIGRLMNRD